MFVLLYLLFWPLCYLFFGIRIMITPSNSSYNTWQFILIVQVRAYQFWSLKLRTIVLPNWAVKPWWTILFLHYFRRKSKKEKEETTQPDVWPMLLDLYIFFLVHMADVPDELHEGFQYCGAVISDMFISRNPYQVQLMTF